MLKDININFLQSYLFMRKLTFAGNNIRAILNITAFFLYLETSLRLF